MLHDGGVYLTPVETAYWGGQSIPLMAGEAWWSQEASPITRINRLAAAAYDFGTCCKSCAED